ncbi:hypothetical protein E2P81_ATG04838 [Venturia nashicola]|uniref:Uncharacterized protein n=1 Tax=Venturia nashicola TaxID=86259 RepID=A0A4Z1P4S9_9PEZI|nr:hypothetical protein E6O75_ATG04959 [Venturia nashicola]TLD34673.1 hypothetical protein E2P81_ATG04838 [Venturia nashicola]
MLDLTSSINVYASTTCLSFKSSISGKVETGEHGGMQPVLQLPLPHQGVRECTEWAKSYLHPWPMMR